MSNNAQPSSAPGRDAPAAPATNTSTQQPDAPAGSGSQNPMGGQWMLLAFAVPVALMLFMSRNQTKKQKQLEASIKVGDEVLTQSGIIGRVSELDERIYKIEIAPGVKIKVLKSAVSGLTAPEPAKGDKDKDKAEAKADAKDKPQEKKAWTPRGRAAPPWSTTSCSTVSRGRPALFALLALLLRSKRGVLVWAAVMAGSAAFAAHYDVFWATAFFGLAAIWAVFCAGNTIDLAWRAKTGFVLFLTLGSALCIYPTYHDERYGKWAPPAELKSDEQAKMEVDARHGDLGWSEFLLTNIPFRLVRGLDLKGGLRLVYTVEVDKAIEDKRDRLYDDLRNALSVAYGFTGADKVASVEELAKLPSKVKVEKYNDQPSIVTLRFDDPANASVINDEFLKRFLKENQLIRAADKKSITFRISSAAESEIRTKAVALAKDTVQKRVDEKGLKEAAVTIRDEDIIIEMPGDDEKSFAETRELVSTTARLEFKMVDDNVDYFEAISRSTPASALPEGVRFEVENAPVGPGRTKPVHFARLTKLPQETMAGAFQRLKHWTDTLQVDPDHEIGFEKVQDFSEENETFDYVGWRTIYLFSKAEVTGDMVRKAEHLNQQTDRGMAGWIVSMEFSPVGADRFEEVTAKNIMRRFAIVLDSKVESAPRILSKISVGGHCPRSRWSASSPDQQLKEAEKLATVLRSGALSRADLADERAAHRPVARPRRAHARAQGRGERRRARAALHGRLLQPRGHDRERGGHPEPHLPGRDPRDVRRVDDLARHRRPRPHHRHRGRRQRAHQRAHPRGAPARQEPARRGRRRLRQGVQRHRRRPHDDPHLGPHPRAVRHGPHQGLRVHAHDRHLREPLHRRRLHAPHVRLGRPSSEGQEPPPRLTGTSFHHGAATRLNPDLASARSNHGKIIKPGSPVFDFMKHRWKFIGLSVTLLVLSVVSFITPGPTLGTDFKGGTEVEVEFSKGVSTVAVGDAVVKAGFNRPDVVQVADASNANRYLVRVQEVSVLTPAQQTALKTHLCLTEVPAAAPPANCPENARASEVKFSPGGEKISLRYDVPPDLNAIAKQLAGIEGVDARDLTSPQANCAAGKSVCAVNERVQSKNEAKASDQHDHKVEIALKSKGDQLLDGLRTGIDPEVKEVRVEWIGPKAGAQLRDAAVKSIAIAIFFIMAYIAIRFDIRFAPGGIVALVHDVGIALGAMVITRRELTLSTVAAMLTIVGYSITDTVIVYDRIRENLGKHRTMTFSAVINLSVSEMLGRTLISSGVTSLSLIMFLVWGTGVIKDFAFALLIGIIVGTYSSIYVAAPITEWADRRFFGASTDKPKTVSRQRAAKKAGNVV